MQTLNNARVTAGREPIWLPLYPGESPRFSRGPSPRNRAIYHAVRVDQRRQIEVARDFQLSPPRVSQIVAHVERWIGLTCGRTRKHETASQRLAVAEYLHRERLESLYGAAVEGWRKSQEEIRTTKVVRAKGEERREGSFKSSPGNPRFLTTALTIEEKRWRFEAEAAQGRDVEQMTVEERAATVEEIVQEVGGKTEEESQTEDNTCGTETAVSETPAGQPPVEVASPPVETVEPTEPPTPPAEVPPPAPRSTFPRIIIHRGAPPPLEPPLRIVVPAAKRINITPGLPTRPPVRPAPPRGSRTATAMPPKFEVRRRAPSGTQEKTKAAERSESPRPLVNQIVEVPALNLLEDGA